MKIDDNWYIKPDGASVHESSGGVVARIENGKILIAMTKESNHEGLVLPKGHVDRGETLESAAKREIAEETGIFDLTLISKLGLRSRLDFNKTSWKVTTYFLFKTEQVDGTPTDPLHLEKVVWIDINNTNEMFWPEQRDLVEKNMDKITKALSK